MILLLYSESCIRHQFITKTGFLLIVCWVLEDSSDLLNLLEYYSLLVSSLMGEKGILTQTNCSPHHQSSHLAAAGLPPDSPRFIEQFATVTVQVGTTPVYSISC
ncbi:MAG: hypothetical protein EZS28_028861 [Streblomastix strix]|uniref:Uncharacterized protein n=1 Tax=Streblomastix strix TaxID=222440 RepID=A0A5J4UZF7_9EUKA|nr:MAG: hypothetical protein EZS28_028861 [Streblomastix strix]